MSNIKEASIASTSVLFCISIDLNPILKLCLSIGKTFDSSLLSGLCFDWMFVPNICHSFWVRVNKWEEKSIHLSQSRLGSSQCLLCGRSQSAIVNIEIITQDFCSSYPSMSLINEIKKDLIRMALMRSQREAYVLQHRDHSITQDMRFSGV